MALLEKLNGIVVRWMLTAPRDRFERLMSGPAAMLDALGEAVDQARFAALPGQGRVAGVPGLGGFDSVDALFLIARDRLVTPAQIFSLPWVTEKPWQLALRLRNWRDDWVNNVGAFGLLDQIAAVMVPTIPVLRLVQLSGTGGAVTAWFTRETDGTKRLQRSDGNGFAIAPDGTVTSDTTVAHVWNWDSTSNPSPPDQFDYSRSWVVAYPPAATPYLTDTDGIFTDPGVFGDAWDDPTAQVEGQSIEGTIGTNAPVGFVSLVQNIILQRRTAGAKTVRLVVAFDPFSFDPDGTSTPGASRSAYPNGEWAWDTCPDDGLGERVVARLQTAEYWLLADTIGLPVKI